MDGRLHNECRVVIRNTSFAPYPLHNCRYPTIGFCQDARIAFRALTLSFRKHTQDKLENISVNPVQPPKRGDNIRRGKNCNERTWTIFATVRSSVRPSVPNDISNSFNCTPVEFEPVQKSAPVCHTYTHSLRQSVLLITGICTGRARISIKIAKKPSGGWLAGWLTEQK